MNAAASPAVEPAHGLAVEWNASDPVEVRRRIRAGLYRGHTGGLAKGYVQANIAVLPAAYAAEFARFCQRNPKPCPLLAMSEPGSPHLREMGEDLDLRTDLPSYRVFRDGEVDGEVDRSELVTQGEVVAPPVVDVEDPEDFDVETERLYRIVPGAGSRASYHIEERLGGLSRTRWAPPPSWPARSR